MLGIDVKNAMIDLGRLQPESCGVDHEIHRYRLRPVPASPRRFHDDPALALSPDLKVRKANRAFCQTFGLQPEQIENRVIYEIGDGHWNIQKLQTLLEGILPDKRHVDDYEMEAKLNGDEKTVRISARRFYGETRGLQMILLALEIMG